MNEDYMYFEKDFYPFWSFLKMDESCTPAAVHHRFLSLTDEEKNDPFIRFAWKVLSDPFYSEMYKTYRSIERLYESGFFIDRYDDKCEKPTNFSFLTTPYDKVIQNIEKSAIKTSNDKPYIVLLTTGGFSPVHIRHMELFEVARETMESNGYEVVGGYFSPSHDNYVSQKYNGSASLHVEKRVHLLEYLVSESDWLYVDKWEAYYHRYSVNFTDVINHLEDYLNAHIPTENGIKVCYVFGADNAYFTRTFFKDGYAVCVNRTGYDEKMELLKNEFFHHERIFFAEKEECEVVSSSKIRNGCLHLMDERIQEVYVKTIKNEKTGTSKDDLYGIRNDLSRALQESNFNVSDGEIKKVFSNLSELLVHSFDGNISIEEIGLDEQYQKADELLGTKYRHLSSLSLDVFVPGDEKIQFSRLFELGSGQLWSKRLTNRPNTPSIPKQVNKIKSGEYVLVEDDVASGNTLRKLFELLPKCIQIKETLILSHLDEKLYNKELYDIIDLRDFIFGLHQSGLVVSLPNKEQVRVPYVLPYTSPNSRAKIPLGEELLFSLNVWEMNRLFYSNFKQKVLLSDLDESFQKAMMYIGFKQNQPMIEIIDWHITQLKRSAALK